MGKGLSEKASLFLECDRPILGCSLIDRRTDGRSKNAEFFESRERTFFDLDLHWPLLTGQSQNAGFKPDIAVNAADALKTAHAELWYSEQIRHFTVPKWHFHCTKLADKLYQTQQI